MIGSRGFQKDKQVIDNVTGYNTPITTLYRGKEPQKHPNNVCHTGILFRTQHERNKINGLSNASMLQKRIKHTTSLLQFDFKHIYMLPEYDAQPKFKILHKLTNCCITRQ